MTLCTNRYQQVTPTSILPTGVAVSTPIYVAPTRDQLKALLNGFRRAVMERGRVGEEELEITEENLRQALFAKSSFRHLFVHSMALASLRFIIRLHNQIDLRGSTQCNAFRQLSLLF